MTTIKRRPIQVWLSEDEMIALHKWAIFVHNVSLQDAAYVAMTRGIPHMTAEVERKFALNGEDMNRYWSERAARSGFDAPDAQELPATYPLAWDNDHVEPHDWDRDEWKRTTVSEA